MVFPACGAAQAARRSPLYRLLAAPALLAALPPAPRSHCERNKKGTAMRAFLVFRVAFNRRSLAGEPLAADDFQHRLRQQRDRVPLRNAERMRPARWPKPRSRRPPPPSNAEPTASALLRYSFFCKALCGAWPPITPRVNPGESIIVAGDQCEIADRAVGDWRV